MPSLQRIGHPCTPDRPINAKRPMPHKASHAEGVWGTCPSPAGGLGETPQAIGSVTVFKEPIRERVMMRSLNLDGDRQADLTVHGGVDKAIYAYAVEHYPYWQQELPHTELSWGAFGENLTIEGLSETAVNIGDRFRIGNAEVMATQPRFPCFKLNLKFAPRCPGSSTGI